MVRYLTTRVHNMTQHDARQSRAKSEGNPNPMTIDTNALDFAKRYAALGWALVAIPAGKKAPSTFGWQQRAAPVDHWQSNPNHNIGLLHGLSGTCALDIDDMQNTRLICEALNIDLDKILAECPRIVGRPDRGKVLFRAPDDVTLTTRKISWPVNGDPRRTEVVFELRAGSVQDVLPPSIHPDTQMPYSWAGASFESLPEIPAQLLTIWREWDRFRPQMMDICPWRPAPEFRPPSKSRRVDNEKINVIDQYNAATPIDVALTGAGYKRFGNRWLSPNSTSKLPGVVIFEDGRAYSHHASDPFDSAHTFDAFEVFCVYDHLGNVSAAVKAAADILQINSLPEKREPTPEEKRDQAHGGEVAAAILPSKRSAADGGIPRHLLTVPGVLGDLVAYAGKTAIKSQPQFDVQAALALGAVVLGQRFLTDQNNMSSLFFLNVGKTGEGKEHARNVVSRTLRHAQLDHLIGPAGYTSEGGVLSALEAAPAHVAMIDEFGNYLSTAKSSASTNQQQALSMMMETYGRQRDVVRNRGYSLTALTDAQRKKMSISIVTPSLTVLAMTTPETFYEAASGKDISSGLLNRFLIVESTRARSKRNKIHMIDPPESVLRWARTCATANGSDGNLTECGPEFPPVPILVPFSDGAQTLIGEFEDRIIDRQNKAKNSVVEALYNRTLEQSMRVSLIVAVSLGLDEISEDAMRWAIDYVDFYAQRAIAGMMREINEGSNDALRKKAGDAIMRAGEGGLSMSDLLKQVPALGNLNKQQRDGLLAVIIEDFPIDRSVVKPDGRGRPKITFTFSGQVH